MFCHRLYRSQWLCLFKMYDTFKWSCSIWLWRFSNIKTKAFFVCFSLVNCLCYRCLSHRSQRINWLCDIGQPRTPLVWCWFRLWPRIFHFNFLCDTASLVTQCSCLECDTRGRQQAAAKFTRCFDLFAFAFSIRLFLCLCVLCSPQMSVISI